MVNQATQDDGDFLNFIEAMGNVIQSSDKGNYYIVKEKYVASFMDATAAKARLSALASSDGNYAVRAANLLNQWRTGDWD